MASDYNAISEENQRRYGTDIARLVEDFFAVLYADRTHFIFELLQNAEDALRRRGDTWQGTRAVTFTLREDCLVLSHLGKPFDEDDVHGVCNIGKSTKKEDSIGRFGIGFKSVYAFTDRPEIYSGDEYFAIEGYVHPRKVERVKCAVDETQIIIPLRNEDNTAKLEIIKCFQQLDPRVLLFLRHIEEIKWIVEGGASGFYMRSQPEQLSDNVRRITIIGQTQGQSEVEQNWLVFDKDVFSPEGQKGCVEIAFETQLSREVPNRWSVRPIDRSPLVVFFPTIVQTHLGFLVQGPYKTTPSRDNVEQGNAWNQRLIQESAELLVQAMRWFREKAILDVNTLRCLPLDRTKFSDDSMFAPFFDATLNALKQDALLPKFDRGYVAAPQAKLARTQDLRDLISSEQLADLFDLECSTWVSGDITQDRTPEVRKYLMHELNIDEVTPAILIQRLNKNFLEAQPNDWILGLYEFLAGQDAAVRRYCDTIPLIRLSNCSHIVARKNAQSMAFLPSSIETSFPTIHTDVCSTKEARDFITSLGITEPDPVDDVVWNILPKYQQDEISVDDTTYANDIKRILSAFGTDSESQRKKLISALSNASFVQAVDTGDSKEYFAEPNTIYLATDRLSRLFAGVPDVLIVNDGYECLRGEKIREMLEACGALRCPRPIPAPQSFTQDELRELRKKTGSETTSGVNDAVNDWKLHGFDKLLELMPQLPQGQRIERARLLWDSLSDLEERRGRGVFEGSYSWTYYGTHKTPPFPAAFLRQLKKTAWVPCENGTLVLPSLVLFDSLGWKANPFVQTKIAFKPPILDQLAKAAGIDPAALDLLRQYGITSAAELAVRLGITNVAQQPEIEFDSGTDNTDATEIVGIKSEIGSSKEFTRNDIAGNNMSSNEKEHGASIGHNFHNSGTRGNQRIPSYSNTGEFVFVSYVGVHPDDENTDSDGLEHDARMQIEEMAIKFILAKEANLQRTPPNNPGYDLYELDSNSQIIRYIEIKAMTGSLENRPVGLSHTQFEHARIHNTAYWLYIVEYANDPMKTRVLKIQDPVTHARTFTFDKGWSHIAHKDV